MRTFKPPNPHPSASARPGRAQKDTTMTEKETILSRIRKLQSLTTDRGATPEEAAAAAAKAQALLFEHNLTASEIDTHETAPDPYGRVEHELERATRTTVQWRRSLLYSLAVHNFCTAVTLPNTTRMSVIGKRSNVETVLYLNQCVSRQIESLAQQASRHLLSGRAAYEVNFCRGAVMTVYQRLKTQREESERAATSMSGAMDSGRASRNAVVLRNAKQELDAAVSKFHPRLRTTRSGYDTSRAGYQDGRAAGAHVTMHRGIGAGRPSGYLN